MTFIIWNVTLLKKEPFMSNRRFKKGTFLKKVHFHLFLLSNFCILFFSKNWLFCYSTTFFESLKTHKRFVFKESYISYGKRQKSCTLIVILVKCLYLLLLLIYNPSAKSSRIFLQSKPGIMFAAFLQPSWPSRPKTNVTLLFYFLKLYNFGLNEIFVGWTSSELQHPWISKITTEPKKPRKNRFSGSI